MPNVTFEPCRMEIGSPVRGRPSYRWVDALYVIVDGKKIYPPMRIREAKQYAKELAAKATGN